MPRLGRQTRLKNRGANDDSSHNASIATYLLPIGIVANCHAQQFCEAAPALPFAKAGAFSHCQYIRRRGKEIFEQQILSIPQLSEIACFDPQTRLILDHLSSPKPVPALAGFPPRHAMALAGIVNVTPDSFSDGGKYFSFTEAIAHGGCLLAQGADIVDIGGESTRPGAQEISEAEELDRVLPVISALHDQQKAKEKFAISIDTRKSRVMQAAIAAGATIVNDVSSLQYDPQSLDVVAQSGVSVILMHSSRPPQTMQKHTNYHHVVLDVYDFLVKRMKACQAAGIAREKIILDPGIGFGKNWQDNYRLLNNLALFQGIGCPVLLGASRKSFLSHLPHGEAVEQRLAGSLAVGLHARRQGRADFALP